MRKVRAFIFLFLLITGSGFKVLAGEKQDVVIEIRNVFNGQSLALSTASYVTTKGDTVVIDRLRYYLSALTLKFDNGEKFSETDSYHLIDAEDPASLKFILRNVPKGKIVSMTFNVGVDSVSSVSGALSGALDPVKGMYWAWNSGYINAKLEGVWKVNKGKKQTPFEFHVGGYLNPYYALRTVTLPIENSGKSIVVASDVNRWFEGIDLHQNHSVMIPGKEAMLVADSYSKMFTVSK